MTVSLQCRRLSGLVRLDAAITTFRSLATGWEPARILYYAPGACEFVWLDEAALPPATFEARIFCREAELRWLRDPSGQGEGEAVILAGVPLPETAGLEAAGGLPVAVHAFARTYILWGRGTGRHPSDRCSTLGTAQIGVRDVPLAGVPAGRSVALTAVEYVAEDGEHGNAFVFDERLTGLALAVPEVLEDRSDG